MQRKISIIVLACSLLMCGFTNKKQEFTYQYEIVLNSNETKDVIQGYLYKEYLIDQYNRLINYLDPSLHTNAIINNIDTFSKDGSYSKYENGKIIIYIGESKGKSLTGSLKKDTCDNSNIRVKFFFSKFFTK